MTNEILLLESLRDFYKIEYNKNKLLYILSSDKNISLRSIDWFITNYSKKNNIYYVVYKDKNNNPSFDEKNNQYNFNLNVYHSYKSQLRAYSKKRFDPFCRRNRIDFKLGDETVETTIGQLNFFKWAINNLILDYIEINKDDIEDDMNISLKKMKSISEKKIGERKKRQELSLSATRGLNVTNIPVEIIFD